MPESPSWSRKVNVADEADRNVAVQQEAHILDSFRPQAVIEKTSEVIRDIEIARRLVAEYFAGYGIVTSIDQFPMESVVVCRGGKVAVKQQDGTFSTQTFTGAVSAEDGRVYVNDEHIANRADRIAAFVHEFVHKVSKDVDHIPRIRYTMAGEQAQAEPMVWRKSGFVSFLYLLNSKGQSGPIFYGFNEAVTAEIEVRAMWGLDEVKDELPFKVGNLVNAYNTRGSYLRERRILREIMVGVTSTTGIRADNFWLEILRGYTEGNKMFLRKIEKAFGPGALDVLARMRPIVDDNYKEEDDIFYEFFERQTSSERRLEIASEVKKMYKESASS